MAWTYDSSSRTYRTEAGQALTKAQLTEIRNLLAEFTKEQARSLAQAYVNGGMSLEDWAAEFRTLLEDSTSAGYLLGKGGLNAMEQRDLERIDRLIRTQSDFAAGFARDLAEEKLTAEQAASRAATYAGAAVHSYEQARAAGAGIELPTYPGDGSQDCLGNCRCEWVIEETDTGYEATWELDPAADHCATCLENAAQYAPYVSETAAV